MKAIRLTEQQLHNIIKETTNRILTESFKSNTLRRVFRQHGGPKRNYRQFSLGDITDEQIGWLREYDSTNDALKDLHQLKKPSQRGQRSHEDMKYHFQVYTANDGSAIVVGVDRSSIETGIHWGGEYQKKVADRLWNNAWNFKTRDNRYVDDSDTYYYQSPAQDFGLHTSNDFQARANDNERQLQQTPKEDRPRFNKEKVKRLKDYLRRNYPSKFA